MRKSLKGLKKTWSRRVGLNHRPTVYETVALPLSYAGSRQNTEKSENRNRPATLIGRIADGVVYTFRHLASSTKVARNWEGNIRSSSRLAPSPSIDMGGEIP